LPEEFKSSETVYIETQLNFIDPMRGWMILTKRSKETSELLADTLLKTTDGGTTWIEIFPVINP